MILPSDVGVGDGRPIYLADLREARSLLADKTRRDICELETLNLSI